MSELVERVARAVCKAFAMDYHGLCEIDANFEADKEWESWIPEAKAAIAAMQADAAPVVDHPVTSNPVVDHETPETSDKLRDAVEVYQQAYIAWISDEHENNAAAYAAAAAVIEADRKAVRAYWYRQGKDDGWQMCKENEIDRLREELAEAYIKLSGKSIHTSDCATSNAPAMEPGPCDCDTLKGAEQ